MLHFWLKRVFIAAINLIQIQVHYEQRAVVWRDRLEFVKFHLFERPKWEEHSCACGQCVSERSSLLLFALFAIAISLAQMFRLRLLHASALAARLWSFHFRTQFTHPSVRHCLQLPSNAWSKKILRFCFHAFSGRFCARSVFIYIKLKTKSAIISQPLFRNIYFQINAFGNGQNRRFAVFYGLNVSPSDAPHTHKYSRTENVLTKLCISVALLVSPLPPV